MTMRKSLNHNKAIRKNKSETLPHLLLLNKFLLLSHQSGMKSRLRKSNKNQLRKKR
jgi:hypothetical protein